MLTFVRIPLGVLSSRTARTCSLCQVQSAEALKTDDVMRHVSEISKLLKGSFEGVFLEGFEPFLYPALVEVLQEIRSMNVERIAMHTDGGALCRAENARGCMDMGVRVFEVSVNGSNDSLHDRIAGSPGLFEAMSTGLSQIRTVAQDAHYSIALIASLEICEHNKSDFIHMISWCLERGFDAIRLNSGAELLSDEEIEQAHAMSTTQGVLFFGQSVTSLNSAQLYNVFDIKELLQ